MKSIKILGTGSYLPKCKITSSELENMLNLETGFIEKRTGIQDRYYAKNEDIVHMAIKSVENLFSKIQITDVNLIITATTTSEKLMPGISNEIQKKYEFENCICLDILAGCGGFINAFDIAKTYIETGRVKNALIIGVDKLSTFLDKEDIGTSIILSDGAGCVLLAASNESKKYYCKIVSDGKNNEILTCKHNEKIYMNGKEIYKYAVTKTVENVKELLKNSNENIGNIKSIIPHQSNIRIIKGIAARLKINMDKMYTNIEKKGNTFCATIPIALDEINQKLKKGDKIILLGYGGGLNTGSILIEI